MEQETSNAAESLAEEVATFALDRRKRLVRGGFGVAIYSVTVAVVILVSAILLNGRIEPHLFMAAYLALIAGCAGAALRLHLTRKNQVLREKVHRLVEIDSVAATGALIDVMAIDDRQTARFAREALARLSPRWTESDFARLNTEQRRRLRGVVRGVATAYSGDGFTGERFPAERAEFRVAICEALARVGGEEELRALKREASMLAATPTGIQVRNAARRVIPILEARLVDLRQPQTLLRGASAPTGRSDELLRALAGSSVSSADLLRADSDPSRTSLQP